MKPRRKIVQFIYSTALNLDARMHAFYYKAIRTSRAYAIDTDVFTSDITWLSAVVINPGFNRVCFTNPGVISKCYGGRTTTANGGS